MNREIKFRVWNGLKMEHNVMAGFLGAFYVQGIDEKDSASMSQFNTKYPENTALMQFTGLVDKKGIDVYEGDIIEKHFEKFEIIWNENAWQLTKVNDWYKQQFYIAHLFDYKNSVVVGNIYENPELINKPIRSEFPKDRI